MVFIQRSCGYSWRPALSIALIEEICVRIHQKQPHCVCFVDNCYGEFVEDREPCEVGADLIAGDGIYSIEVQVRSGVPSGIVAFDIRGLDIQGAQTPLADRTFSIEITTSGGGSGGSETVFEGASTPWVLLLVILLVIVSAGVGIYVVMRKSDFQEIMGVETLDSKESYVQALIKQGYPEETARAHVEKHADRFKEE